MTTWQVVTASKIIIITQNSLLMRFNKTTKHKRLKCKRGFLLTLKDKERNRKILNKFKDGEGLTKVLKFHTSAQTLKAARLRVSP